MHILRLLKRSTFCSICCFAFLLNLASCDIFFKKKEEREVLARVGENFLYKDEVAPLLNSTVAKQDSASFVANYVNNWATRQLLLSKAKFNLPDEKLQEFDRLVTNYRTDLYTRAYKEALIEQGQDTLVTRSQLRSFYKKEKENFRLSEKLVSLRFIQLPRTFLNKEEVIERLKRFNKRDVAYLDSIGVQFKKLNFNDSLWIPAARVIREIPPLTDNNQSKYLKKSQFFELRDPLGVYLGKVTGTRSQNAIAPLSYIEPRIKQVLLNRRKLDYIRKLETEIMDQAIKDNEFEIYESSTKEK